MRTALFSVVTSALIGAAGTALAAPPATAPPPRIGRVAPAAPVRPPAVQRVTFGDDDLEVSRARPFDDWVLLGGAARHASLVPLRASFFPELLKSAEEL